MKPPLIETFFKQNIKVDARNRFSFREVQIISFLVHGYSTKHIALFFDLSPRTVDNHLRNILYKIDGNTRQDIVSYIQKESLDSLYQCFFKTLQYHKKFEEQLGDLKAVLLPTIKNQLILLRSQGTALAFLLDFMRTSFQAVGFIVAKEGEANDANAEKYTRIVSIDIKERDQGACVAVKTDAEDEESSIDFPHKVKNLDDVLQFYTGFFAALKEMPLQKDQHGKIKAALDAFSGQSQNSQISDGGGGKATPPTPKKRSYLWILLGSILILCVGFIALKYAQKPLPQIRSDIILPQHKFFLERKNYQKKLSHAFGAKGPIQVTLVTGIGGAGKTTIVRQFLNHRKADVIWEISADSKNTIRQSFEELAAKLAQTPALQEQLAQILQQKDRLQREKNIIAFVRKELHNRSWILFFDGVHSFADIKHVFPCDPKLWGRGNVIITSRNTHLRNARQIHTVIPLEGLSMEEGAHLFSINLDQSCEKKSCARDLEIKKFLSEIPPYPLDILIAAHYMRSTHISPQVYVGTLKKREASFEHMQQQILKDVGAYQLTRSKIIQLAVDQMIGDNSRYQHLLIFIAHCYGQSISRDLLAKIESPLVVDSFIYALKKFSLIDSDDNPLSPQIIMHKSIQAELRDYMQRFSDAKILGEKVMKALYIEAQKAIYRENFDAMKALYIHVKAFLKNKKNNSTISFYLLKSCFAIMNYYLGEDQAAIQQLKDCISFFEHKRTFKTHLAQLYTYLGNEVRRKGQYGKSMQYYQKSMALFGKEGKGRYGYAKAAAYLGRVYEKLGRYAASKQQLEKAYRIFKTLPHEHIQMGWIQSQLGKALYRNGDYERSIMLYEKSIQNYKQAQNMVGLSWVYGRIALSYTMVSRYEKALAYIDESLKICHNYFHPNHVYLAKALFKAAIYHKNKNEYARAEDYFMKSLRILIALKRENNPHMADFYYELGDFYVRTQQREKALHYLEKGIRIYKSFNADKITLLTQLMQTAKKLP